MALNSGRARVAQTAAALTEAVNGPRAEDIAAARANLRAAEATLTLAQTQLSRVHLIAPDDGTIMTRVIEPGTVVLPAAAVYSMAIDSEVWVRAFVPEPLLASVAPGTAVSVTTDGGKSYHGRIGYVSPAAEFTPKTVETPELRTQLVYRLRVADHGSGFRRASGHAGNDPFADRRMTAPLVVIEGLRHAFPGARGARSHLALDDITASIQSGIITGLVGPDAAGKTTLLRLIAGLLLPTAGRISVLGHDMAHDATAAHPMIGYMPQRFGLYEDLTVAENLDLFADLHTMPLGLRAERVARLLHFTGLAPFTARLAGQLSGGMKQKLGLACALLSRPRLLLLDEPSVGVDPASRRELWAIVSAMLAEGRDDGMGVVWATAYLDEAARCGRVLLLHEARLLADVPPDEFVAPLAGRVFRLDLPAGERRRGAAGGG